MVDRQSKLRRLEKFRRAVPHVSANALSSILSEITRHGMPEMIRRNQMREARDFTVDHMTYYGKLLQEIVLPGHGGGDDPTTRDKRTLVVSHPLAMLQHCLTSIRAFGSFFRYRLGKKPCTPNTPWHLVLYTDEVLPGNVLAPLTLRKSQAIYWTFLELGAEALCREDMWFCITAKRSTSIHDIEGSMAKIVGCLIKCFFSEENSLHPDDGGVTLIDFNGEPFRFFVSFDMFIQDGGAHKLIWNLRGDGGTKFCLLCKNALALDSTTCIDDKPMLRCDVIHESDLEFATDDDVRGTVFRLNCFKVTDNITKFKIREQALGFTWTEYNLLSDPDLTRYVNPCSQFCHDWMHCLVAAGLFQLVLHLLLESLESDGIRDAYVYFQEFVKLCRWPIGIHSSNIHRFFDDNRRTSNRKAGTFKCQASDALSMYPVLAFFVLTQFRKASIAVHACDAFIALCDVIDLFQSAARGVVTPNTMRDRVHIFLQAFVTAFGADSMIPKCHWLLHFANHLQRWGILLSCFVTERKHKMVKRYANECDNTGKFEHSVMAEVVCHHLAKLSDPNLYNFETGLIEPHPAPRALSDMLMTEFSVGRDTITTATTSRISKFAVCSKKDIVLYTTDDGFGAGEVWAHVAISGVNMSIISEWRCIDRSVSTMSATWEVLQNPIYVATDEILAACTWAAVSDNVVRTFIPPRITVV